jgi:hypothetical protein
MTKPIRIRSLGDALDGFRKTWKALEQGKKEIEVRIAV